MKIKRIIAILLSALICLSFAGCGSSSGDESVPEGMKVLEQASNSYTIYIPQSWIADMSTGFASAYASETDASNISFTAYTVPSDETTPDGTPVTDAETYWESYEAKISGVFTDIEYETYGDETAEDGTKSEMIYSTVKLGELDANKYVFTAKIDGTEYKFIQIIAVASAEVYVFTYTATPEKFDSHLEQVEMITSNMKLG